MKYEDENDEIARIIGLVFNESRNAWVNAYGGLRCAAHIAFCQDDAIAAEFRQFTMQQTWWCFPILLSYYSDTKQYVCKVRTLHTIGYLETYADTEAAASSMACLLAHRASAKSDYGAVGATQAGEGTK